MLLLVPLVQAHPGYGGASAANPRSVIGHRMELTVGAHDVDLRYVAEVPEKRILEEARQDGSGDYGRKLLATVTSGVALTWNGEPLPAEAVPLTDSVKAGEKGFLDFAAAWHATLPSQAGTLGVRDGNFLEEPGFFATSVTVDGALRCEETSLLKVKNGRIRDNWHGAWVRDESAREPWVRIRPAGLLERATGPAPLPERMAGVGEKELPLWAIALLALSLIPLALLGRWLGRRAGRLRR